MTAPNGTVEADLGATILNPKLQMRVLLVRRDGRVHLEFREEWRCPRDGQSDRRRAFSVRSDRMADLIDRLEAAEDVAQRRKLIYSKRRQGARPREISLASDGEQSENTHA